MNKKEEVYYGARAIYHAPEMQELQMSEYDCRCMLRHRLFDADVIHLKQMEVYKTTPARLKASVERFKRLQLQAA